MMRYLRVVLAHPAETNVAAQLNLHGVQQLLEQEGVPLLVCAAKELEGVKWREGDVLVVAESECLTAEEEEAVVAAARRTPLVWCGLPREGASAALLDLLGLRRPEYDRSGCLCRLLLSDHALCAGFTQGPETCLKMKYVERLVFLSPDARADGDELVGMELMDGRRLGPAVRALDGSPRRVVWTFPLGYFFAVANCRHVDIRVDAEWLDWPLMTYLDVLRGLLRECLRWAAPPATLLRKYYWPLRNGTRPTGVLALSHDLCGYSEEGVRWICEICDRYGVQTSFYDMPPARLKAGEVGDHVIGLHAPGSMTLDEIREGLRELEQIHGRKIIGWRRHGATQIEHYPDMWRRLEQAGVKWGDTWPPQSHPHRALCSPTGRANRLPYDIMDLQTGRRLGLLDLAMFDSDDADRLAAIPYGMRLNWNSFRAMVETRLDFAAKHHVIAGYLLHGWTAGVREETLGVTGALDAQRMLPHVIEAAHARGMACFGGDELYRWWTFRRAAEVEVTGDEPRVTTPGEEFTLTLETFEPWQGH